MNITPFGIGANGLIFAVSLGADGEQLLSRLSDTIDEYVNSNRIQLKEVVLVVAKLAAIVATIAVPNPTNKSPGAATINLNMLINAATQFLDGATTDQEKPTT